MTQPWSLLYFRKLARAHSSNLPAPFATPIPQVAKEYDAALVESKELPRKPAPPAEGEDAGEE